MSDIAPLEVRGLVKTFEDVVAVDGIDLSLRPDELLVLVGPSGCGKSTILRSIAGLLAIDAGTIVMGDRVVDDSRQRLPPERRSTGIVFQDHALFPHLTVRENVAFGVRRLSRSERTTRLAEMLRLVSLDEYGDRYPHELSGGERQRVALARALAPRPALMLFDEPFASLDHNLRVKLRGDVVAALRATGTPAVFVTHDQEEALAIGDRIAVVRSGRIVQLDTPEVVFHEPIDRFVAAFMGDASFLPVHSDRGSAHTVLGPVEIDGVSPAEARAMVRPDDVKFMADADGDCEVIAAEYHGSGWLATIQHAEGTEVLVATSHLTPPAVGSCGRLHLVEGHRQIVLATGSDSPATSH